MDFPGGSTDKESGSNAGDLGLIPGEGNGCPLQYSGLENSMDCIVHGVASDMKEQFSLHRYIACISSICLSIYHLSGIYVERESANKLSFIGHLYR